MEKEYNTHLVILHLDNDKNNYYDCGDLNWKKLNAIMKNDCSLMTWLHFRDFGGDNDKIRIEPELLDFDLIRQTIKDNHEAINN